MTKEELKNQIIELKEELEKEAEEYVKQNYCEMCVMADDCKSGCIDCYTVQAYIASAEPREKRIAELEKENAELTKACDETQELLDKQIEATYKLYKENAELKKQLEMSNKVYNDNLDYSHHIEGQLTNAKEIIREFMKYEINEYDGSLEIHFEELKKQAEQFLKESEVEK